MSNAGNEQKYNKKNKYQGKKYFQLKNLSIYVLT